MNAQLDLFTLAELAPQDEIDNAIIEAAFDHVENQHVLRQLLAGKSWTEAFGQGGRSSPVSWWGDSKGITVEPCTERERLIKPAQIIARAKLYKPKRDPNVEPF